MRRQSTRLNGATQVRGFSLIEVLIVLVVLIVLASLAVPQYLGARIAAYDTTAKSDLRNAMTALHFYSIRNDTFPASASELMANDFDLSPRVVFTKYKLERKDGGPTVHMHVQHEYSPNAWHANYPKEGTEIEMREGREDTDQDKDKDEDKDKDKD